MNSKFTCNVYKKCLHILQWNDLLEIGKKESEDKLENILKTIGVNECCTLVYTVCTIIVLQ